MTTIHDRESATPVSALAEALRERASQLWQLAAIIERLLVHSLAAAPGLGARADLCEAMLQRNMHQLHAAADDLRTTAHRMTCQAERFDRAAAAPGASRDGEHAPARAAA